MRLLTEEDKDKKVYEGWTNRDLMENVYDLLELIYKGKSWIKIPITYDELYTIVESEIPYTKSKKIVKPIVDHFAILLEIE